MREDDGVDYIFNFGGRIDQDMLDLIPPYRNVRVRFIDSTTLHSDTCTFQQTLLEQGDSPLQDLPAMSYCMHNCPMTKPMIATCMREYGARHHMIVPEGWFCLCFAHLELTGETDCIHRLDIISLASSRTL